ncbi:upf0481 protein [Quercus suber]|uniref:Upf0481 protein n=1 Tax=Quercus suber TaxID=58331 RepID=A0AAW0KNF7_QUESU
MEARKNVTLSPAPKIQKVIFLLRDNKDFFQKHYEPRAVSLGPIHHGNEKYKLGEKYKLVLTYEFVEGSEEKINDLFKKIKEKIKELKECFEEEVIKSYDDEDLIWLLLVDGCATLQYIYCAANNRPKPQQVGSEKDQESRPSKEKHGDVDAIHLLDLLRTRLLDKNQQVKHKKRNGNGQITWPSYRNVQELRAAGIHVERSKKENSCLRDISFTTLGCLGFLWLPPITVDDSTMPKFLNLIAYEMCLDFQNDFAITSYISFLDSLIDEPNDVKMLRKAGILYNCLGSDEEVARVFNEIGTDLVPNSEIYRDVRVQIQKHYKSQLMTWFAQVYHDYFSSPWKFMAFFGALLALALSFRLGMLSTLLQDPVITSARI